MNRAFTVKCPACKDTVFQVDSQLREHAAIGEYVSVAARHGFVIELGLPTNEAIEEFANSCKCGDGARWHALTKISPVIGFAGGHIPTKEQS